MNAPDIGKYDVVLQGKYFLRELIERLTFEERLDEISCRTMMDLAAPNANGTGMPTMAPGHTMEIIGAAFGETSIAHVFNAGPVWDVNKDDQRRHRYSVTVYDKTICLAKSEDEYLFAEGTTATQRIKQIAGDWNIPVYQLAETGQPLAKALYRSKNLWSIIQEALREEMQRDESVFIMGEDVGLYGGAYGATRGLFQEFGQWRVIDTPISEATIGGAAVGAAMAGMRPVAEIMYVDFTPLTMDQIANQGAKNRYMFGGKTSVPMVVRTEGGAGRAIAAHHSQSLESLWTHFPGIYVVMPATPYDVKGLLKAAIRDNNPVMFIEHKMLYKTKGPVPQGEYLIPLGVADVKRRGKDLTIVTYSRQVLNALEAAEMLAKEGIDAEVIDLRSLKPLDAQTIVESVKKTGRLVGVTEAYENTSFINEVMAVVNEQAFDWLDAPMQRVAAANVPVPRAEVLEDLAIPNVQRIVDACRKVMR